MRGSAGRTRGWTQGCTLDDEVIRMEGARVREGRGAGTGRAPDGLQGAAGWLRA